jgi:hypothetical protein
VPEKEAGSPLVLSALRKGDPDGERVCTNSWSTKGGRLFTVGTQPESGGEGPCPGLGDAVSPRS